MDKQSQYRYDVEAYREYVAYTLTSMVFLCAAGISSGTTHQLVAVVVGILGLVFAIVVLFQYHHLIQSIDEIEGFFSHFGVIYFMKFSFCFIAGVTFVRQQYIECIASVFIAAILSIMLIYGYRDMLKEKFRIEAGERTVYR